MKVGVDRAHRAPLLAAALLVSLLSYLVGTKSAPPRHLKLVRAQRFELVDSLGRVRATFTKQAHGPAGLGLTGPTSPLLAAALVEPSGRPCLPLFRGGSHATARLDLGETGDPTASSTGADGRVSVALGVTERTPVLFMNSGSHAWPSITLGLPEGGNPSLSLFDPRGRSRLVLQHTQDDAPGLFARDSNGSATWFVP